MVCDAAFLYDEREELVIVGPNLPSYCVGHVADAIAVTADSGVSIATEC